jgi:hypothetical protein
MNTNSTHEISLQTAIDMTTLYRVNRPSNFPICETFEKDAILALMETTGCAFLRIYYGMKPNLDVDAILVAVNDAGEDILPPSSASADSSDNGTLLEDGYRCPEACPPSSPLNS